MADLEEKIVIKEQMGPKGRAAVLEGFKGANPDFAGEPDDECLFDFVSGRARDAEERYNALNRANSKLAELVSRDPKLGAVLSMIAGEGAKSFPYAISSVYGKGIFDLEGEALEDFERGYQENLATLARSKKAQEASLNNIAESNRRIERFVVKNGLDEGKAEELYNALYEFAENLLMGIIPDEFIDVAWKGLNYDTDVQEAAITGEVEGRNAVIDAKMRQKVASAGIPDLNAGAGAGSRMQRPYRKRGSFYDEIKEV